MKTRMPLAKPWQARGTHPSLRCAAFKDRMGRLRRRKSCRRSRSAMKKMKARSTNRLRARPLKKALRRSRNGKARASGADAAAVEEADVTVLLTVAHKIRQPEIAANRRSR